MKLTGISKSAFAAALSVMAVIKSVGCSRSDDDSSAEAQNDTVQHRDSADHGDYAEPDLPIDANPFIEPEANGATTVARPGYSDARDQADYLVSTSSRRLYYDLDTAITILLQRDEQGSGVTISHPGGGRVSGEQPYFENPDTVIRKTISNAAICR
ncbi:MAG: hypothetical protein HKN43_17080 [Rhodothermales bacterium]|nr:hypothetical protein [Rhodothermales bacterium]